MENKKNSLFKIDFKNNAFSLDDVAKGLLLFLVFETAVSLVYQIVYMLGFTASWLQYLFNALLDVGFVMAVFIVAKNRKHNMLDQLKIKKAPSIMQILLCLCASLVCIFGFSGLTNCFLEVLYRFGYQSVGGDIVIANIWTYLISVVSICVLPAICEEILFRGLVFTGLKKKGNLVAVLGSAFIFMIMHGSPDQTVHQFILGVILAVAFLVTENIWVPITIHFLNNFIAVSLSYFLYGDSQAETAETVEFYLGQYFLYAVVSAVIAGCLIYLIFKGFEKLRNQKGSQNFDSPEDDLGTIDAEKLFVGTSVSSSDYTSEIVANAGEVVSRSVDNKEEKSRRFSKEGKVIFWVSIIWLVAQWVLALVSGFGAGSGII